MNRSRLEQALLYARTIRHLRPVQVAQRARLRSQRVAFAQFGDQLARRLRVDVPGPIGWPAAFTPLDGQDVTASPSAAANARGAFRFLREERALGSPPDWHQASAPQLWRYHLHYFEWGWAFADDADQPWAAAAFRELWRSWRQGTTFGRWDAWSPYVVSLRSWALCALYAPLIADSADAADYIDDLSLSAGYLRTNLELDVGGNHLIKNLKSLAGLGVFLGDGGLVELAVRRLEHELRVQILADGGHFERSPSYHCQVLGDLLDVSNLLAAAGRESPPGLPEAVDGMRRWLGTMLMPDGDVPLFNDCTLVGEQRLRLLEPAPRLEARLAILGPSGYVVVRPDDRLHLVADVGLPCPPELPAHAHADCLSFELAVDGERVVVDSGTSTYAAGPQRDHERSTAAHNTVEVDGTDQTEVWGTFRAARRAHPRLERAVDDGASIEVTASHDGYRRLTGRPRHRRTWLVSPDVVQLVDEVFGGGVHTVIGRLHISPAVVPISAHRLGPLSVSIEGAEPVLESTSVATGFGVMRCTHCLVYRAHAALPFLTTTTIRVVVTPADDMEVG